MKTLVFPPLAQRCIWFHCASGEFEYAIPILELLRKKHPAVPIVVSYTSPSYAERVSSHPGVDFAFPLPWDFASKTREVLRKLRPRAVLVVRTDFWPRFLLSCRKLKVPVIGFAVRTPPGFSFFDQQLLKFQLSSVDHIYTVDTRDEERLKKLNLSARALGDSRWDRVFARLEKPSQLAALPGLHRPLAVFGSTWPEDDRVLTASAKSFCESAQIAWVPHEVDLKSISKLENNLKAQKLRTVRLSALNQTKKLGTDWDVLIVDQVGYLADLYREAFVAFVGGSFAKQVHSVMEPLGAGCRVLFGPQHLRSPEALMALHAHGTKPNSPWALRVRNSEELNEALRLSLEDLKTRPSAKSEIIKWSEQHKGASLRITAQLEKDLPPEAFH